MTVLDYVVNKANTEPIPEWQPTISPIEVDEVVRKATLTEWFVNPVKGQPRYVDIYKLRAWGRSEWVASIISYLINRVKSIEYEFVAKDPKKRQNPSTRIQSEIRQAEKLFDSCTQNSESFKRAVETPLLRDILELDAGVLVKNFTVGSYMGNPEKPGTLHIRGKRNLAEFRACDGGSFLKDIKPHYVLRGYWQFSYTRPLAAPVFFDPEEIVYISRYPRSYSPYGWASTQNADAILNSLINSAVWNSNFFSNQGIPKGMITLDGSDIDVKRFRAYWRQKIKSHWYDIPVINREAKFVNFAMTAQDMQWLSGQKWYQRLMCALFQVHPSEIGVEDTSRQAGQAAEKRDRIQKRSSVIPLLLLLENAINPGIVAEISPRIMFKYMPEDTDEARLLAETENRQIELGLKTINQLRVARGETRVPWGDLPPSLLNNLIRSFSRMGMIPGIEELNQLSFDSDGLSVEVEKKDFMRKEEQT